MGNLADALNDVDRGAVEQRIDPVTPFDATQHFTSSKAKQRF
ncbi:hypothetical protein [Paraburkholderia sp. BCC1886]|nr:hypothetical protein [Paraburkholderia sp. BCC1886]